MHPSCSGGRGPRPHDFEAIEQPTGIHRSLMLETGGGADEAPRWMEHFGEVG